MSETAEQFNQMTKEVDQIKTMLEEMKNLLISTVESINSLKTSTIDNNANIINLEQSITDKLEQLSSTPTKNGKKEPAATATSSTSPAPARSVVAAATAAVSPAKPFANTMYYFKAMYLKCKTDSSFAFEKEGKEIMDILNNIKTEADVPIEEAVMNNSKFRKTLEQHQDGSDKYYNAISTEIWRGLGQPQKDQYKAMMKNYSPTAPELDVGQPVSTPPYASSTSLAPVPVLPSNLPTIPGMSAIQTMPRIPNRDPDAQF